MGRALGFRRVGVGVHFNLRFGAGAFVINNERQLGPGVVCGRSAFCGGSQSVMIQNSGWKAVAIIHPRR